MTRYGVALGSNIGDRLSHLRNAVDSLDQLGDVDMISAIYETEPIGGPDQAPFLNAVVSLTCEAAPEALLHALQAVEEEAGRERKVKWGPRSLDLDIISWDGPPVSSPDLVIPHPRAIDREFVLRPLCDVWPDAEVDGLTRAREALSRLDDQGVDLLARKWVVPGSPAAGYVFVAAQFVLFLALALAMAWDGTLPDASVDPVRVVGLILAGIGASLALMASRRLGDSLTANPEPRSSGFLVVTGPYRLVRHPIYGGVILFITGAALMMDSFPGALLSLGLIPFFYWKSSYEERRLRLRFARYASYVAQVPRRLIPYVI